MTFREKLKQEHPELIGDTYLGGCASCPHRYGYEDDEDSPCRNHTRDGGVDSCKACWDREIPEETKPLKQRIEEMSRRDGISESEAAFLLPYQEKMEQEYREKNKPTEPEEKPEEKPEDGAKEARLIYLLGQIKGVAACISEHRTRTTLTNAVNGVLAILQAPTGEEDMDK